MGATVENGSTDGELGGLSVEVADCEAFTLQPEAPHLGHDATSSVTAAPGPLDRSAETQAEAKDVVAGPEHLVLSPARTDRCAGQG